MCMLSLESGACVMCVSVFVAYYQLTNSLVEKGEVLHSVGHHGAKVGGPRGKKCLLICEAQHVCLSTAHCLKC